MDHYTHIVLSYVVFKGNYIINTTKDVLLYACQEHVLPITIQVNQKTFLHINIQDHIHRNIKTMRNILHIECVCVCLYACVCVCVFVCVSMCVFVYVCMIMCACASVSVCVYACICVRECVF